MKKIYVRPDSDEIAIRYEGNILSGDGGGLRGESIMWDDENDIDL